MKIKENYQQRQSSIEKKANNEWMKEEERSARDLLTAYKMVDEVERRWMPT
jgi:hypothetical protein